MAQPEPTGEPPTEVDEAVAAEINLRQLRRSMREGGADLGEQPPRAQFKPNEMIDDLMSGANTFGHGL
jgi:hypothetical protein